MLSMTAPAGSLVKTTLVDFPGRVASAFFLSGCNLRCPYCYNKQLVENSSSENYVSIQQLFDHLEKRKNIISGPCVKRVGSSPVAGMERAGRRSIS